MKRESRCVLFQMIADINILFIVLESNSFTKENLHIRDTQAVDVTTGMLIFPKEVVAE